MKCLSFGNFLLITLSFLGGPMSGIAGDVLRIEVEGVEVGHGSVILSIFASSLGFPVDSGKAVATFTVPASKSTVVVESPSLNPGSYAVALFQDVNENRHLDLRFFGPPAEPFGFSQNPKVYFGAPTFKDSQVSLKPGGSAVSVRLRRWSI